MKLRAYEGKRVTVITSDRKKYSGVVTDYIFQRIMSLKESKASFLMVN